MKITVSDNLSWSKSVDYTESMPYIERLKLAKAIDLCNNARLADMGNGYGMFVPIDETKTF